MSDAPLRFGAVILAAGLSTRMHGFKPLLPLGGKSLLAQAGDLFRRAGAQEIVAVTGHRAAEVRAEAARLGLKTAHNPDFESGMFSSVRAGLAALSPGLEAAFVLPVDIPLVRLCTLRQMLERLERLPFGVVEVFTPWFRGEPGHPPLLRSGAVARVLESPAGENLRAVLAGLSQERLDTADSGILFDLDTDADYTRALHLWERRGAPAPLEALTLLELRGVNERGLAHARAVTRVALILGRALVRSGSRLDLPLLESAALLHDICKNGPRHEAAGGRLLNELGFPRTARIVASHRDVDPARAGRISERELVYLADKLVRGPMLIGLEERFREKLEHFAGDPDAQAAISGRRDNARAMMARFEAEAGQAVDQVLAKAGLALGQECDPGE
ncbi:MAG TPA: phosphohydrolase [Desulfovibrio sp.]|nr:phosphohydrolase [Desulfovibrio sp.]